MGDTWLSSHQIREQFVFFSKLSEECVFFVLPDFWDLVELKKGQLSQVTFSLLEHQVPISSS